MTYTQTESFKQTLRCLDWCEAAFHHLYARFAVACLLHHLHALLHLPGHQCCHRCGHWHILYHCCIDLTCARNSGLEMTPDSKSVRARFIKAVLRSWFDQNEYFDDQSINEIILILRIVGPPLVSLLSREDNQGRPFQAPGCSNFCTCAIKS